jgi:PelA/Pel-15E family pectate lyase
MMRHAFRLLFPGWSSGAPFLLMEGGASSPPRTRTNPGADEAAPSTRATGNDFENTSSLARVACRIASKLAPAWIFFLAAGALATAAEPLDRAKVLDAMKRATTTLVEKIGYQGGYVWSYLPDLSREWGEMEANRTMMWLQAPGTLGVGHALLDAYHATGDEYYYEAARKTAEALIKGQHPAGGWNYMVDLAGEQSMRRWYETIGKNGWRLEEFQHYYGNATFDDSTTADASRFMLRFYLEKKDPAAQASLEKAISFVLKSQYPSGGWPQRFPPAGQFSKDGNPDYTGCITFNDGVCAENIDFLVECHGVLGRKDLLEPIRRGMDVFIATRQPPPQAGWSLQHTPDLKPAGARTYEPKSLATHTTASNIEQLLNFYALTGDPKYLSPIPDALAWLDSVKLTPELAGARGGYPTFVELGTNQPLFIHRSGSNVVNGRYFADRNPTHTIGHYSSFRMVNVAALRERYEKARAAPPAAATKDSPLRAGAPPVVLPRIVGARGFFGRAGDGGTVEERAARAISTLDADGVWLTPLRSTSHRYQGDGPKAIAPGDFGATQVGDDTDTSPYGANERVLGISTATFAANLGALIRYLETKP